MKYQRDKEKYKSIADPMIKAMDLKVGDVVKVTRKSCTGELGWNNTWAMEMDSDIGREFTVKDTEDHGDGILLSNRFYYPIFVLEKTKDSGRVIIEKITAGYDAVVEADGTINVGCQTVNFKKLEELYLAARKAQPVPF